ncbi:hypothetical protein V8C26DRAFT_272899 [Trichoderma gracile]
MDGKSMPARGRGCGCESDLLQTSQAHLDAVSALALRFFGLLRPRLLHPRKHRQGHRRRPMQRFSSPRVSKPFCRISARELRNLGKLGRMEILGKTWGRSFIGWEWLSLAASCRPNSCCLRLSIVTRSDLLTIRHRGRIPRHAVRALGPSTSSSPSTTPYELLRLDQRRAANSAKGRCALADEPEPGRACAILRLLSFLADYSPKPS